MLLTTQQVAACPRENTIQPVRPDRRDVQAKLQLRKKLTLFNNVFCLFLGNWIFHVVCSTAQLWLLALVVLNQIGQYLPTIPEGHF